MSDPSFLAQLRERRVIRAALIYVALLWVALQAADLLAGAGIIPEQLVRWLILLGVIGLPITLVASWFLESPWQQRRWTSVAGDLVIIVGITLAAALFAWQQWFTSFTRPAVAVLHIEATDLRDDSADLAAHLALRLRMTLATRSEIRVIELSSSQHPALDGRTVPQKAEALGADYVLTGTVAQMDTGVRLNIQLFDSKGQLVAGESIEDRLLDLTQLQDRALEHLSPHLPLPGGASGEMRAVIAGCRYPEDRSALLALIGVDNHRATAEPAAYLEQHADSGMLQLALASRLFAQIAELPALQRPVTQQIAMQHAANAAQLCPLLPDARLLRVINTNEHVSDDLLREFPNAAALWQRAAGQNSDPGRAEAYLDEARLLDPLGDW